MKKLILLALLIVTAFSCEDFEGWNIDKKHPGEVSGSYLVTNAQRELAQRLWSNSVNYNIFSMYAQHWTETTYNDEANYDLVNRNIGGNFWNNMYLQVMANLTDAKSIIAADASISPQVAANQIAIIDLMMSYTWAVLVDTYGHIPYSQALLGNENLVPAYDADEDIYMSVFNTIDTALNTLSQGGGSFGSADLIYNGNVDLWSRFGNTLKLKMATRIADYDSNLASTKANEAVQGGVLENHTHAARFPFESAPPNTNPLWVNLVQSGRSDFVMADTFVDLIVPLNDPRTPILMDDNVMPYVGGPYGGNNSFNNYTHIGAKLHEADLPGTLMDHSETEFLLAEAAARGLISADAEYHYKEGVKASISYWMGGTTAGHPAAEVYLAQDNDAIKWDAANWKKQLGTQKWIAMFGRGFEAWSTWRMTDYPMMNTAEVAQIPVPRRYIYPNTESSINTTNYEAASSAMGGDVLESRVFWDINGVGNTVSGSN